MNIYASEYYQRVKETCSYRNLPGYTSLADFLWGFYAAGHQTDAHVFDRFMQISPVFQALSKKRQKQLVRICIDLCIEREHDAFLEGVRLGSQMICDLTGHIPELPD